MAMVWYGGSQHDGLWEKRWRTSLYHAWLRGADPIYAEHGVMDYHALGKKYGTDHPDVKRFRRVLGEFAAGRRTVRAPLGCRVRLSRRSADVTTDMSATIGRCSSSDAT